MSVLRVVSIFFRAFMVGPTALAAENLALRQQLAILEQTRTRPRRWLPSSSSAAMLADIVIEPNEVRKIASSAVVDANPRKLFFAHAREFNQGLF